MVDPTQLADLAVVTTGLARSAQDARGVHLVLETAEVLPALAAAGHLAQATVVFVPSGAVLPENVPCRVVEYRGALAQPADQFWLDESFVMEVQAYAVGRFLSVHGPTLLRITGGEDLEALVDDATLARDTGRAPRIAASPMVHLADAPALGWYAPGHVARRLHIRADGTICLSPTGSAVGHLEGLNSARLPALADSDPASALAAVVPTDTLARMQADCPWLPRHLAVVAALRSARARGVAVEAISGFGARLDMRLSLDDGLGAPSRPVILITTEGGLVVDPLSGRAVAVDRDKAAALERYFDGDGEGPGGRIAHALAGMGLRTSAERVA